MLDEHKRLVGRAEHPAGTLGPEELQAVVLNLAGSGLIQKKIDRRNPSPRRSDLVGEGQSSVRRRVNGRGARGEPSALMRPLHALFHWPASNDSE